jgi:hypothetical protein
MEKLWGICRRVASAAMELTSAAARPARSAAAGRFDIANFAGRWSDFAARRWNADFAGRWWNADFAA